MLPTISAIVFIKLDFVRNMVFRYGLNGPIRNGHVRAWSVDYLAETSDNYKVKHLPLPQVFLFREIHSRMPPKLPYKLILHLTISWLLNYVALPIISIIFEYVSYLINCIQTLHLIPPD